MSTEAPHTPIDPTAQRMREIVGLILETHAMEVGFVTQASLPRLSDLEPTMLGSIMAAESSGIDYRKSLINMALLELGGIGCRYDDMRTGQVVTSKFIAWNGLAQGRTDQHVWHPIHAPETGITVSVNFLIGLQQKYFDQPT